MEIRKRTGSAEEPMQYAGYVLSIVHSTINETCFTI